MGKMRVVAYLDEEQLEGLELYKRTSVSEVVRRAVKQFLNWQAGSQKRSYNPDNPPGRKPRWRRKTIS